MARSTNVWIVLQQRDGALHRMSREAIAAGQKLAGEVGGEAHAVILGSGVSDLAQEVAGYDLAGVHVADVPALADYTPGAYVGALAPAIREAAPGWVVFPHTYQTVDYFARLAQETGSGLLPEVISFEAGDGAGPVWTRPILGGKLQAKVRAKGEGTVLVSVQSGAFSADGAQTGASAAAISDLARNLSSVTADREILEVEEVGGDTIDLSKSDIVVAVGRGIGGTDKMGPVEALAKALGADIGASRPVIDSGWLPRDRQIGSSGQTVSPKLYLALAISGAIQHVVGMKGSSTIVAINKDPNAPIFTLADYGVVGDVHELVPLLTEAVEAAKG